MPFMYGDAAAATATAATLDTAARPMRSDPTTPTLWAESNAQPPKKQRLSAFSAMVALHPSNMSRDASLDMVHSIMTSSSSSRQQHSTTATALALPQQPITNQQLLELSSHTNGVVDAAVHSKDNMAALKLLQMKQQRQQQQLQLQQIQQHQHRQRLFADLIASASRSNGGSGKNQDGTSIHRVPMNPSQGMPMLNGMAALPPLASARAGAAPTPTTPWSALANQQGGHFHGLRPAPNATSSNNSHNSNSHNLVVPVAVSRALSSNVNQYLQYRHHQHQAQFQQRFQDLLAAKTTQPQSEAMVAAAVATPQSQNSMMVLSRLGPQGPQDTNQQLQLQQEQQQRAARLTLFAAAAARQAHAIPPALPVTLYRPSDACKLSRMQALLRQHVQLFSASSDDVETHVRGRSKPIALHQVGIRCKHCTNVHILQRAKGSTYFPTSVWGIYQASQNMGTTHFVSGQCAHMPQDVKDEFAQLAAAKSASKSTSADEDCMAMPTSTTSTSPVTSTMPCKPSLPEVSLLVKYSGAGRAYWAQSAMYMGLVDTEEGVFFIRTLPRDVKLIDTSSKNAASLATTGVYRRAATKPPKGPLSSSSTALPPGTSRKRPAARTA